MLVDTRQANYIRLDKFPYHILMISTKAKWETTFIRCFPFSFLGGIRMDKQHNQQPHQHFKNQISDGLDIEFSQELADHDDLEAQKRSEAADKRAKQKRNKQ